MAEAAPILARADLEDFIERHEAAGQHLERPPYPPEILWLARKVCERAGGDEITPAATADIIFDLAHMPDQVTDYASVIKPQLVVDGKVDAAGDLDYAAANILDMGSVLPWEVAGEDFAQEVGHRLMEMVRATAA